MEKIIVNGQYYLTPVNENDIPQMVMYCNDEEIYKNTLRIAYPYTPVDAKTFLNFARDAANKFGREVIFVIRDSKGLMIGSIGIVNKYDKGSHKEEIGYWLGKPFRGQGITTECVKAFCNFLMKEMNYVRLEATAFVTNIPSQKTLLNAGFEYEGLLRKAYLKEGKYFDCKLYSFVK